MQHYVWIAKEMLLYRLTRCNLVEELPVTRTENKARLSWPMAMARKSTWLEKDEYLPTLRVEGMGKVTIVLGAQAPPPPQKI